MTEPESARLFVALELPADVRSSLTAWAADVVGADDAIRVVPDDALHVTLCFLGATPLADAPAIVRACEAAAGLPGVLGGEGTPELRVSAALWLPRRRPRALAVGLTDELGLVSRYQSALARELADGGWYTPEARPYLVHTTVARVRSSRTPTRRSRERGAQTDPPPRAFRPDGVAVMRSRLGAAGARYERLGTVSLG